LIGLPLLTQPIDESHLITLSGSRHPLATASADRGAVPDSMQLGRMIVMLKSSDAQQAALRKLLDDQQNSKSTNYHQWLKPEQFGTQFGAASQDVQKITQWLGSYGFEVEPSVPGRNLIFFSGTHAQLKAAFHTELHRYEVNGKSFYANATDPQIPAALAPVVAGFSSLNNFPRSAQHTRPQIIRRDKSSWKLAALGNGPHPEFTTPYQGQTLDAIAPYDLATIYNFKSLWDAGIDGTDQTIAIVSDSDINPADVDYFRSTFGLPATKLNIIYDGVNPGPTGNEGEADLDVQWAGAVAKNATIDLVVAADSATSAGIDAAAAYIINNNLASILNVSYGACELALGTQGNLYYNQIWQQAAAQGITVLTAAGDAGSALCDDNQPYAQYGLSVSGLASTPYNVAVGGTDFYASFVDPNKYWSTTNESTTLQSVLSYIPETPWNDSCANPQILTTMQAGGTQDKTAEALCNDGNYNYYILTTAAGSGGASNCSTLNTDGSACLSGTAKPAWQSGVLGIPTDGVRDLPDVSLMAGNGVWNSLYVYCESDATGTGACDVNNSFQGAGGTSFASPIFAGMLALVQQKTASQLGNVNYTLYKLASKQYAGGGNAASCSTENASAGNACIFYDITDGTNAVPCLNGTADCKPAVASDQYGILPGYEANAGFDLTTGLGSINAFNLVNGWSTAATTFLPTTSSIAGKGATTAPYGTAINVNVSVAPSAGSGNPSGDVAITTNSTIKSNRSVNVGTLSKGHATIPANYMLGGSYQLFARYGGDATFAPSLSTGLSVTITPAPVGSASLFASRSSIASGQYTTLTLSIPGVPNGVNPTGTVLFTNTTTGKTLGTQSVAAASSTTATPVSSASITIDANALQSGANTISATYSGDANYSGAFPATDSVSLAAAFTASLNPASLIMAANTAATVEVTVTPIGTTALSASALTFSCPANLPTGLTCAFSTPVATSAGSVTSTLSLQTASPLFVKQTTRAGNSSSRHGWLGAGAAASLAGLLMLGAPARRRRTFSALVLVAFATMSFVIGCGGSSAKTPPALIATTTALSFSSPTPAFNSPVTLTGKVTPASGRGTPTGTVTFMSGSTSLGSAPLASGVATFSATSLPAGSQTITAVYGGDSTYTPSTSTAGSLDVVSASILAITVTDSAGNSSIANLALTVQ
jgi:subtilase family serine protease